MSQRRQVRPGVSILAALASVGVALALIPPEDTIGGRIRLVYAHGAGIWIGMFLYSVAAALALASLARRHWLPWAFSTDLVGTGFMVVSDLLALLSMQLVWGGLFLAEPRMITALKILAMSVAVHAVCWAAESLPLRVLVMGGRTALAWWLVATTQLVMHPDRPVLKADFSMQIPFFLLLITYLLVAFSAARAVRERLASWLPAASSGLDA